LSEKFGIPLIKEYAREFIDHLDRPYKEDDLSTIAKGHYNQLVQLASDDHSWVIMDTDFLTIKIWGDEKFGKHPASLDDLASKYPAAYYLLCKPDIPWEFDPQRENSNDRDRLFEIYLDEIAEIEAKFEIISGDFDERILNGEQLIRELLNE